jgi:predicted enzyme related to lactoylglutathione lyase
MTTDPAAGGEFYRQLFRWEVGDDGMAKLDGHAVAGLGGMMGMAHPPVWSTYLASADLDSTAGAVRAAGGAIVTEPTDAGSLGRMLFAQAPGGGVFGAWQAVDHIGIQLANEPGSLTWNEFMCRDYEQAKEFYASVFGYSYTEIGEGGFQYSTIEVNGNTVGGIGGLPAEVPPQVPPHWRVYFAVDDCDAAVRRVGELGGAVHRPPQDMPYGRHADVADPQGAMFSVIKPASPG